MATWRTRPITDTPPILIGDRVWVHVLAPTGQTWLDRSGHARRERRGQARVVLAVMGGWAAGRPEILHDAPAAREDTEAWTAVRAALKQRGLDPNAVRLVVSDGRTGRPAARATAGPAAHQPRGVVDQVRGLERACCDRDLLTGDPTTHQPLSCAAARRRRRQQVTTDAHAIFEAPTRAAADQRLATFPATWRTREPAGVRKLSQASAASCTL